MQELTSWADVVEQSVVATSTKQCAWKDNSVERDSVFAHELVELHFLGVLPPLLPLISVAGSDWHMTIITDMVLI